ncbi:MAG: hypothetical protein QOI46_415 [Alphaproteobacteria bacterium]|nr:hypothetical protein [Alphaproteobacteria bacterium]
MDLFVVPTIGFKLLYVFVIVRLNRRDLVCINVTTNPNAEWFSAHTTPKKDRVPWSQVTVNISKLLALAPLKMGKHIRQRLDIAELCINIEEVPGNDAGNPVADAFARHDWPKILGDCVFNRIADAAGGRDAGRNDRVYPHRLEHVGDLSMLERWVP